tara:strand:- start:663 stop:938 length:276 start_codon:yes stop_codon:yes gene_type:complete
MTKDYGDWLGWEHAKPNDSFTYPNRTWDELEDMLDLAERKQNYHEVRIPPKGFNDLSADERRHVANAKALQGVIKCLRWVLGDKNVEHPLE